MKLNNLTLMMLVATPLMANAAGLDRSEQQIEALFEPGNYAEVYYARVMPTIEGTDILKNKTKDTAVDYNKVGAGIKFSAGDGSTAFLLQYDQPWGVNTEYESGLLKGTIANIRSDALTAVIGYKTASNFWAYGGVALEQADGKVIASRPLGQETATQTVLTKSKVTQEQFAGLQKAAAAGDATAISQVQQLGGAIQKLALTSSEYTANFNKGSAWGYLFGLAYEYPEIAMRADITYRSKTKHSADIDESIDIATSPATNVVPKTRNQLDFEFPQSINVNIQTGIMADTLLMTKFRWVNWKNFDVAPVVYKQRTGTSLATYGNDQYSGSIGIGRRFSDSFSGSVTAEYDSGTDKPFTPLGPYGDTYGFTVAGKYKVNEMVDVSAGVNYTKLGDADIPGIAKFEGNDAIGIGTKLGFHF